MSAYASRPNGPRNEGQKLPDKFRCKIGLEWKPWTSFSKKQQKLVTDKLARGVRIDAERTGMVCRQHSGEPVKEIQCEGPCSKVRPLDDFSKNNRSNGVYMCKLCQHWTNTQEPGYAPWAGPNTSLDPLEAKDDFERRLPTEPSDIFDFHDENEKPLAPITGTDGLIDLNGTEIDIPRIAGLSISDVGRHIGTPSFGAESMASSRRFAGSIVSDSTNASQTGEINPTNYFFGQTGPGKNQASRRIQYNAWDSTGQQYQVTKSPTVQSGRSSPSMLAAASARSHTESIVRGGGTSSQSRFGGRKERQADRKQLSEGEHRALQRNVPQRTIQHGNLEGSDDSDA
ncbi:hypothetical protein CCHL11_01563 [Colletotrichum chlorophyti]|uniref:Stc1 domain-containing protein n=1 Tax=Colletotrichum chlorophyti TaxID=708187 RepID=A0A1Q8RYB5_9PEZI|nr:hypothetical protein CCHL11_01563 [Colletotrichum chlorophyti]